MIEENSIKYQGGENIDLRTILVCNKELSLKHRVDSFYDFITKNKEINRIQYSRKIVSEAGPEVLVEDEYTGKINKLLMFGSNNYLGLASHPYVKEKVKKAIDKYGVGVGGPPLLNGYTILHKELEESLSEFKGCEDTLIFGSGYSANVGLVTCLVEHRRDVVFYDEYSHASFFDGLKMSKVPCYPFEHNNHKALEELLSNFKGDGEKFISVEGVYSMDGDLAPLDKIAKLAKSHNATIILDDAHGTLIKGKNGAGTASEFGVEKDVAITMGTFSKAFAVSGGFVSGSKEMMNYLRFLSRAYMFSASLPIPTVAAVIAGLEVSQKEPELRTQLFSNTEYVTKNIKKYGLVTEPESAIIALRVPDSMNIRQASNMFHQLGIFVNAIEYPAVPKSEQRIRISIMATHTKEHLDRLIETIDTVWRKANVL
jgi:glycine C-acetyltransferase